ncbi:TonB-dependent receptor [Janthinobacterium sp. EB271-G4-7A]|uniref:TonB-dependent receptor n=1 Tax=Janthinobacterium sp. EB271-G4-7A TaxID=2775056 RepID=UPI001E620597|nr:TonB-dependent receptor [Janthinobacterium sp. EB271-G4-7A]MCC7697795.1 TonB-dependent receptor [Janthinobacterium sp. EB271-G4-7A]
MLLNEKKLVVLVRLAMATAAGLSIAGQVQAQQTDPGTPSITADKQAQAAEHAPTQKVYVTGSNVRRIELESASPVQIITREELTRGGATSLNEVLRTISANIGGVNENKTDGFTAGAAGLNLRGLGSQATLMLINGRRLAAYAQPDFQTTFVDINSIPVGAVERIEILKDGASAIYGSEAIAGVINIILRSSYEGLELSASLGQSSRSDGETQRANITFGKGSLVKDHFNAYATLDVRTRKEAYLHKRDAYLGTEDLRAWGYKDNRTLYTYPGNLFWTDKATGRYVMRTLDSQCPADRLVPASGILEKNAMGQACVFDNLKDSTINAGGKTDRIGLISRITWQANASTTVFGELMLNRNTATVTGIPHWLAGQNNQPTLDLPITHPQYPKELIGPDGKTLAGGNGTVRVRASLRDFPSQGMKNTTDFSRYLAGAKGDYKNWDWETAILFTGSKVQSHNSSAILTTPFISAYHDGRFIFGGGSANEALFRTITTSADSTFKSSLAQIDAKISGELFTLPAGAVGVALGTEFRRESLSNSPDSRAIAGELYHQAQSPPGISNSRHVSSVYGEATIPLLKNLEASLAARHDRYSDYGSSTTPKVGLKWSVTPAFLVRGTYAKGFRAPTLVENSTDVRNAYLSYKDTARCNARFTLGCDSNSPYRSGANKDLKPETAKNLTLGIAWEPSSSFLTTLDVWQIERNNEISTLALSKVLADPARYANNPAVAIVREPLTADDQLAGATAGQVKSITMLLTNVAMTQVRGLDLKMVGRLNLGEYGTLHPQLNLSHTYSFRTAPSANEKLIQYAGVAGTPTVQGNLGLGWKKAAYNLSADVEFIGKMSSFEDRTEPCKLATEGYPALCKGIASFTVFNLGGSYSGFKNTKLSFAVRNAFDRKPPFYPHYGNNFISGLHGSMGRYFQLTADYAFK